MKLQMSVHVGGVDGQTDVEYQTNSVAEAISFLRQQDHEGSKLDLRVVVRDDDVYQLLAHLDVAQRPAS